MGRQDIYNNTNNGINGLFKSINDNFTCMSTTLPEDKKKIIDKEIKAVSEKLEVTGRFEEKVKKVEEFCTALGAFDASLKTINVGWQLPPTSWRTSRLPLAPCFLRTELPGPWTCRRTSPPRLRSWPPTPPLRRNFCPRATRFPLTLRTIRTSSTESPST